MSVPVHTDQQLKDTCRRLRQLAQWIEENVPGDKLNMKWFLTIKNQNEYFLSSFSVKAENVLTECGSSACVLGWEALRSGHSDRESGTWLDFSQERFPACHHPQPGLQSWNAEGLLCFSSYLSSEKGEAVYRLRNVAYLLSLKVENA